MDEIGWGAKIINSQKPIPSHTYILPKGTILKGKNENTPDLVVLYDTEIEIETEYNFSLSQSQYDNNHISCSTCRSHIPVFDPETNMR